ncbi:uncharacterized protein B0I36DRAFT_104322 [Microdochium trichocladiopsis]|uniref:NACHT domain-containing protein n=1 Tax=Microdochium trichocladiopsis TaxID=1682393 RepID=A0A9P8YB07_9PEZI|nr:uncharacterized protein B0I36DRAFT_104322 [Microdochium trichocladiopsis]KAH7033044.1 hypothetical protein B0I36DRAFT_104322 [Microdochium trichocladiopsis]
MINSSFFKTFRARVGHRMSSFLSNPCLSPSCSFALAPCLTQTAPLSSSPDDMLNRIKNKLRGEREPPSAPQHHDPSFAFATRAPATPQVIEGHLSHRVPQPDPTPSGTTRALVPAGNQIGLFPIDENKAGHDCGAEPVDIIAIHGLNGHPYTTWTHDTGSMWLRDALPKYMPGCHVYTFGYASKWAANQSVATVPDFARSLLDALRNLREKMGETRRSTIFVCHSLGGIVCKQALVFAHMDQKRYGDVLDSTIGVVFLGTPHCGSNLADLGVVLGRFVNILSATGTMGVISNPIKRDLFDALTYDSESLQELDISVRHLLGKIMVISFYETLPLPPLKTPVVSRQSAILGLPDEDILPLNLNHRDMCRFACETSECRSVCQAIRRIQTSVESRRARTAVSQSRDSSTSSFNNLERSCMKLFSHFDLRDYKSRLPLPVHGTCAWIRSHPLFVSWVEKAKSTVLWLTGHSGCGKTILSYSVATRLEEGNQHVLMYFCDKKITSQQDGRAILTGLIFQLVHRHRRLIRHIRREFEVCGARMVDSFATLWSVFNNMIKELKGESVYVVIDALDECETSSCKTLLGAIRELIDSSSSQEKNKTVKFLLTSRPMVHLLGGSGAAREGLLEIDNGELGYADDVRQFIHQRVDEVAEKHGCSEHTKRHLLEAMLSKSGNTFLWTHMVLTSLEDSLLASAADFDSILATLPPSLESTYSSFLAKIAKGNLTNAHRLLGLILGSSRSLRLEEINCAFTITSYHQNSSELLRDCQPAIARTIQGIVGPLVRLSGEKVSLVHQSVREFLLQPGDDSSHSGFYESCPGMPVISVKSAALQMANACILYLLLGDFQTPSSSSAPSPIDDTLRGSFGEGEKAPEFEEIWEQDTIGLELFQEPEAVEADLSKGLALRHPFYDYAATSWHHHYSVCEDIAPPELADSVITLLDVDALAGQTWRSYARSQAIDAATEFPQESCILVFASYLNLVGLTSDLLQHSQASQEEKDEALFWSASRGHGRVVSLLLDAGADPEYHGVERQTALLTSAASGHLECARQLVASGRSDVNVSGKAGRTALSLAAGNGHHDVVKYLLKNGSTAAGLGDRTGATPFIWASGRGHLAILSTLAKDPRVDVNSQDSNGRTALSWAAGEGMEEVVSHLLKRIRGVDLNLQDKTGRTAFSWACGNGHVGVIRTLLQNPKLDRYQADHGLRNPISWAAARGHEGAIRILLANKPQGLEDKDIDGWNPMAWAVQNDAPAVVEALFDAGAKNLEEGPRTVLSWAMEYGHLAVVRMLLAKGADPETARDRIPPALSMGRFDLVNELSVALNKKASL